jgi:hypothetical protein
VANQNGNKYGFTALFPIKPGESALLRTHLRTLDRRPCGSPLSCVSIVHMARLAIVDQMPYQGLPAKSDTLNSAYLLFLCEFDGTSADTLVQQLLQNIPGDVAAIWQHCRAFPGTQSVDRLADYFARCQLKTTLFLADRPIDSVEDILRALVYKQQFSELLIWFQQQAGTLTPIQLKDRIRALRAIDAAPAPHPGSL